MTSLKLLRDQSDVSLGRIETPEHLSQRSTVAHQPLATAVQQKNQIVASVHVEFREDFVEVDVRLGVGHGKDIALGQRRSCSCSSGVERDNHVFQAGLGAQQHRCVRVDSVLELRIHLHGHHRTTLFELNVRDLTDRDAGDVDGLALAGSYSLSS